MILNDLRGLNHEKAQEIQLQGTVDESSNDDSAIIHRDHVDLIGKPKGRPPKLRKAEEYTKCKYYDEYKILISKAPEEMPGKRRCGLCKHYDHTIRTCPLRLKAINEE